MPISGDQIFGVTAATFEELSLRVFRLQAANNPVYRQFIGTIGIEPASVSTVEGIPFLPIRFFKTHRIVSNDKPPQRVFKSSGTTEAIRSLHHVTDLSLYSRSLQLSFERFYGPAHQMTLLAMLPTREEAPDSSLVFMASELIRLSNHRLSAFYWNDPKTFIEAIKSSLTEGRQTVAVGLTSKWLELAEGFSTDLAGAIIMETGGMKGGRELVREELHDILSRAFNVQHVHSEYGMTELLSQAYATQGGHFISPPWMRVLVRDIYDPMSLVSDERTGVINIIDLANMHSCSFIATDDLGLLHSDGAFEVLGRLDDSDIRGCNLMTG